MPKTLQEELKQSKPFVSLEVEAYISLVRTEAVLSQRVDALFKQHGITQTLYNLIRIIRGGPKEGVPCAAIAERLITRVPDVTRLVDRAVKQGLVSRKRPETDRRVVLLRLTKRGDELLEALRDPLTELHAEQLGRLSQPELKKLIDLLSKLRTTE